MSLKQLIFILKLYGQKRTTFTDEIHFPAFVLVQGGPARGSADLEVNLHVYTNVMFVHNLKAKQTFIHVWLTAKQHFLSVMTFEFCQNHKYRSSCLDVATSKKVTFKKVFTNLIECVFSCHISLDYLGELYFQRFKHKSCRGDQKRQTGNCPRIKGESQTSNRANQGSKNYIIFACHESM